MPFILPLSLNSYREHIDALAISGKYTMLLVAGNDFVINTCYI